MQDGLFLILSSSIVSYLPLEISLSNIYSLNSLILLSSKILSFLYSNAIKFLPLIELYLKIFLLNDSLYSMSPY